MECSLGKGELLSLTGGRYGLTLRCLSGTIWLTKGDGRDYLVRQGSSFELQKGALALVEALGCAELRLQSRCTEEESTFPLATRPAGETFLPRLL